jgi:predicted PurR-regulated permease PerM
VVTDPDVPPGDPEAERPSLRFLFVGWTARGAGLAVGIGIVAGIVALAAAAANVLLLLFLSILLAAGLEPFIGWLRARLPLGRGPTILVVYAVFFLMVAVLALLVLPAAITQAAQAVDRLPTFLDQARAWAQDLRPQALSDAATALVRAADRALRPPAQPTDPQDVLQVGLTLAEVIASLATMLALVFFWLVGHARLQRYVLAFLPPRRRAAVRDGWNEVETRLGLWVRGQLTLMGIVGLASGIAYVLLGVPAALLLGVIAGLCEGIPLVGPIIGAVPAVIAAATVSPELALVVVGVATVIQLVENNLLVPVIMRNTIGISPLILTVSLLIGAAAGGIIGALIAVPIAAALEVILGRLQDRASPVVQDPAAIDTSSDVDDDPSRSLPDSKTGLAAR